MKRSPDDIKRAVDLWAEYHSDQDVRGYAPEMYSLERHGTWGRALVLGVVIVGGLYLLGGLLGWLVRG